MKIKLVLSFLLLPLISYAHSSHASTNLEALGRRAVSENASEAGPAIAELRAMGPAGLNSLVILHSAEINRYISNPLADATPEWQRLSAALDAVSQQKDSYLSELYWYTDLAQAEAAAKSSGKPILSLRLLGNLNEELSCANSRFFRTVLYSNAAVSQALRERFILHWQSVRPAPHVTIDFGDGRKLERTITGNSIHYVLDSHGHILDALPGLYGPQAFLRLLAQAEEVSGRVKGLDPSRRAQILDEYHRASIRTITVNWLADAQKAGGKIPESLLPGPITKDSPVAIAIAPLAITKMGTERPVLRAITIDAAATGAVTDEEAWNRIAWQHIGETRLDDRSVGLMKRQAQNLMEVRESELRPGMTFTNLLEKFRLSISLDTVRNEYMLHTKLHAWLIADPKRNDVEAFNEKVYAELFLTPRSDPWLGLFSFETYTALEEGGVLRR